MPSISLLLSIFLIFFIVILLMYIVYLNSEFKRIMNLYSEAIQEQEKMEKKFLEYNEKTEAFYKEIADLKVDNNNLNQDKELLKRKLEVSVKTIEALKAKVASLEDIY